MYAQAANFERQAGGREGLREQSFDGGEVALRQCDDGRTGAAQTHAEEIGMLQGEGALQSWDELLTRGLK